MTVISFIIQDQGANVIKHSEGVLNTSLLHLGPNVVKLFTFVIFIIS